MKSLLSTPAYCVKTLKFARVLESVVLYRVLIPFFAKMPNITFSASYAFLPLIVVHTERGTLLRATSRSEACLVIKKGWRALDQERLFNWPELEPENTKGDTGTKWCR